MNILLTGATGFIGQHILHDTHYKSAIITTRIRDDLPLPVLSGMDVIIHLAGKAHDMKERDDKVYLAANAELTKKLAIAAKKAGVKQFIYASSVKVYGNRESEGLNEYSVCRPDDAYGKSKLLAEQYLKELAGNNFIVSIVRIPLVYGFGVKGNMKKLLSLAQKNIPLPFGNIRNRRSIVFVGNLIALIDKLVETKATGIFIAGDKEPVSTTRLVLLMRKYSGKKANLLYIPQGWQRILKKLRYSLYIRLFGSFVIDNTDTNKRLTFQPPYSTEEGIAEMITGHQEGRHE